MSYETIAGMTIKYGIEPEQFCETTARVGDVPPHAQIIFRRLIEPLRDPLLEVEYKGRRATVRASDIKPLPYSARGKTV